MKKVKVKMKKQSNLLFYTDDSFSTFIISFYRSSNSHGFKPVCFLKAVEKCEIDE